MTNCPNCGGIINLNEDKCGFCGTPYYDLSCIPLSEPFILRLNIGTRDNPNIVMAKVYITGVEVEHNFLLSEAGRLRNGKIVSDMSECLKTYRLDFTEIREYKRSDT